ncbi:unnamed protein product [Parnassius mnemosyne]|uniref:Uncharacterized protein n=1 Tax=Parnassius mnemosyne TaxID=213953 RepID=A0AAV1KGJ6_9NEOP
MPKVVKSSAREMILKVKEFYEAEQKNQGVLIPLNNVRKRVAAITEAFESITAEDWTAQCTHVEHLEEEYLKKDGLMDEEMDRIIISKASNTETESDSVSIHSSDSDVPMAADHNYSIKL